MVLLRKMEDPIMREWSLQWYRMGCNHTEVARALNTGVGTLSRERDLDRSYANEVAEAMSNAARPLFQKLHAVAAEIDAEGMNEGALKAADMLVKFYDKELDREQKNRHFLWGMSADAPHAGRELPAAAEVAELSAAFEDAEVVEDNTDGDS